MTGRGPAVGFSGPQAPIDAQYLTLALNALLSQERRFVPGTALAAVDGGADADYILNHIQVALGDLHQDYYLASGDRAMNDLRVDAATTLTIAAGAITRTQFYHSVDTELAAASDNLDAITGGAGVLSLLLRPADAARTVVVRHNQSAGTGNNILLSSAVNFSMDDLEDYILLVYDATLDGGNGAWAEVTRNTGGLSHPREFDAIVEATGAGDFTTLSAAIASGARAIFFKSSTDVALTIVGTDNVERIIGENPGLNGSLIAFPLTCRKEKVLFENLLFANALNFISSGADIPNEVTVFACGFTLTGRVLVDGVVFGVRPDRGSIIACIFDLCTGVTIDFGTNGIGFYNGWRIQACTWRNGAGGQWIRGGTGSQELLVNACAFLGVSELVGINLGGSRCNFTGNLVVMPSTFLNTFPGLAIGTLGVCSGNVFSISHVDGLTAIQLDGESRFASNVLDLPNVLVGETLDVVLVNNGGVNINANVFLDTQNFAGTLTAIRTVTGAFFTMLGNEVLHGIPVPTGVYNGVVFGNVAAADASTLVANSFGGTDGTFPNAITPVTGDTDDTFMFANRGVGSRGAVLVPEVDNEQILGSLTRRFADIFTAALTTPMDVADAELTLDAAGNIVPVQTFHRVDTFGGAGSDNLDTMTAQGDGSWLILRPESDARTVVVRHNQNAGATNNILLADGQDFTMDDIIDGILLVYDVNVDTNGAWRELSSSFGRILSALAGTISDAQHGSRTQATAHRDEDIDTTGMRRTLLLLAAGAKGTATDGAGDANQLSESRELAANDINIHFMAFDQATSESAFWCLLMPDSWDGGNITATFIWTAAAGAGTVTWGIQGQSYANDEALDNAMPAVTEVTDTLLAVDDVHESPETAAFAVGGAGAGEYVIFEVTRNIADTLTADAQLLCVKIEYVVSALSD